MDGPGVRLTEHADIDSFSPTANSTTVNVKWLQWVCDFCAIY